MQGNAMNQTNQTEITRSTPMLIIGLVIAVIVCFSAGGIGATATGSSVTGWYMDLNKPSWNPPGWVFGPVWSVLYIMMAVSVWLVWKDSKGTQPSSSVISSVGFAIGWFLFHLLLNMLWSIIFFGLKQPGWALIEIVVLWVSIVVTIVLFRRHSTLAAGLLFPYLMWVSFASFLNFTIWSMNRAV